MKDHDYEMVMGMAPQASEVDWGGPREKSQRIIDAALSAVGSSPYTVSLRFVFYRLLNSGLFEGKDKRRAYNSFKQLMTRARYAGLISETAFADDTRAPIIPDAGNGDDLDSWLEENPIYVSTYRCSPDFWSTQQTYIAIAFEARAMTSQFRHYTRGLPISLWPMSGDPSFHFRAALQGFLSEKGGQYDLPVVVLYFGDLDTHGENIAATVAWVAEGAAEVYRPGLTIAQARSYNLPTNPERPSQYQWEALGDTEAGDIITEAIDTFIDREAWRKLQRRAEHLEATASELLAESGIEDRVGELNEQLRGSDGDWADEAGP